MKVFSLILLALLLTVDPATVKKINSAKSAAESAFKQGDYQAAIKHYTYLVDSLGVNEDEVLLNLANALYLAKDTANAVSRYQTVTSSPKAAIRSRALQHLGIMANQQGRSEEALNLFKQSIKADPANDLARYNYEMLKKKLEEQKKQQQQDQQQNQDQQKQDQQKQDQEQKDKDQDQKEKDQEKQDSDDQQQQKDQQQEKEQQEKEQQEKEQQEKEQESNRKDMPNLDREKLNDMNMTEEKARMILEAMRNQEKQYLQQQKRKPTQSRDRNKPDW